MRHSKFAPRRASRAIHRRNTHHGHSSVWLECDRQPSYTECPSIFIDTTPSIGLAADDAAETSRLTYPLLELPPKLKHWAHYLRVSFSEIKSLQELLHQYGGRNLRVTRSRDDHVEHVTCTKLKMREMCKFAFTPLNFQSQSYPP